ncbi:Zinc finger protein [Wickerhamomyces ciferrii]|uniref:Zinc finger protein n=1 Tax=Wickerhamomyces ciferrii (strain ATCC 14091 / BCRC 22168 / CBS 111 / JCM 3599 / NBRC 0793 / NRRL Y-1031 F-60-10) TaxID=1206466 RepID=K0KPW7_WICCF|nr:Zinc finger protein [Wickerhamomyces ciferrii]CCH44207.1 Zinc finger protein [Wickerhamomyces ciferrii]
MTSEHLFNNSYDNTTSTTSNSSRQNSINDDDLSMIPQEEIDKFLPSNFPMIIRTSSIDNNNNEANDILKIPLRRQIFNDKKILKQVLTKPKKGVYMCNHCDEIFYTFGELLDHFDQFDVKRPHKCSHLDCPWKIVGFNRVRQLNRHESSVHSTDKEFKCHISNCNKKFGRVDLLNRHLKSVHENKNSRFNRKLSKDLSQHQQNHQQGSYQHNYQQNYQGFSWNSPTGSLSSIDDHDQTSPVITPIQINSQRSQRGSQDSQIDSQQDSSNNQRRNSKYKHTIEFLTNSNESNESKD